MVKRKAFKKRPSDRTKTAGYRKKRQRKRHSSFILQHKRLLFKLLIVAVLGLCAWLVYLDARVTSDFENHRWAVPAKVYAQPLELYPGAQLTQNQLQSQIRRQGYRGVTNLQHPGTFSRSGHTMSLYVRPFRFADATQPARIIRLQFHQGSIQKIQTGTGKAIPLLRLDPQLIGGIYPTNYEDRILVTLDQTPDVLKKGLIAVEDRGFYQHHGIAPSGIARAMLANIKARRWVQGGSTLTQQLIKNFYLTSKRSLWRKLQEIPMALLLEAHYSKADILENYLNEVFLGQNGRLAIHGFGTASQFYFHQPVQELSPARAALLIALVKGASFYNPWRHPQRALARRNLVLDIMADQNVISVEDAEGAKQQPLGIVTQERFRANQFPAYLALVKRQLQSNYDQSALTSSGLRIFTNMNPMIQQQAQKALTQSTKALRDKALQGAVIVTNAQTGDVTALAGDVHGDYHGFNRALDAKRSIGSLVKPAVYLTALEHPKRYTLATLIKDIPLSVTLEDGKVWQPDNYSDKSHGDIPLYLALAKSYNLATARLGLEVGLLQVYKTLKRLGVSDLPETPMPSLLLGALSLSPFEVAGMYQTLANQGFYQPLQAIQAVQTDDGQLLTQYPVTIKRVFSRSSMFLLQYALRQVMLQGTGRGAYSMLPHSFYTAGKTGTSNNNRDSWFAGFSQRQLTVVWLGHDDNSPTHFTGAAGALKVWTQVMQNTRTLSHAPNPPQAINFFWIDPKSGKKTYKRCAHRLRIPFVKGSEPQETQGCSFW